jgi:uncharacterized protein
VRAVAVLLALTIGLGLGGCGAVDDVKEKAKQGVETAKREVRKGIETAREKGRQLGREAEKIRDEIQDRVNGVLAKIEGVVPKADEDTVVPTRELANTFQGFMGSALGNVDRYWVRTFAAAGIARPRVKHVFIPEGETVSTNCQSDADDFAAFYCPADDTIYVGQALAREVLDNIGDFGVAYVLAHEYAHNVQQELGWFDAGIRFTTVAPFELQADCMAGAWAYAVYREGLLQDGDVEEAVGTAYAVGDFDLTNPQHHGTPDERADAWTRGYDSGDPSDCRVFVEG